MWLEFGIIAACAFGTGCNPAKVPLWPDRTTLVHIGSRWQRGVAVSGKQPFEVMGNGYLFRASALGPAGAAGEVRLEGPRGSRTWRLAPGGAEDLAWATPGTGSCSVTASPGVILGEPRLVRPRRNAPLIVFALADTFRADHLNEKLTPQLLAQFRGGERFDDAESNAPWTLPSVASIFTSRPTLDLTSPDGGLIAIPVGITSWAEALQARGFSGGAFVANFTVTVPNDFGRGFETFVVPARVGPEGAPLAGQVIDQARAWLRAHSGEAGFLYLHFMDQHEPYHDHEGGMPPMAPIVPLASRAREASPEETRQRLDAYAATVRYLDRQLGPFLAELPPQAVVAFTSDHGEAFGEHGGCWGHGMNLYREALHVPLLLRGPGVPAKVERRPVQLLDLVPTLLGLAGCPLTPGMAGRSLLGGGSAEPDVAVTFSAGPLRWRWREGAREVLVHTVLPSDLIPESQIKLQEVRPLPTGAFVFDLGRDPGEEHPDSPDGETALAAAQVFAAGAGKLVPGLQVLAAAERGPTLVAFRGSSSLRAVQVFSVTETRVTMRGDRVEVRWDHAFPFALVAFTGGAALEPARVDGTAWQWLDGSQAIRVRAPGSFLWWDARAVSLQRGYEETLARLRSLGYIQ